MAADDEATGGPQDIELDAPAHVEPRETRVISRDEFGQSRGGQQEMQEEAARAREAATETLRRAMKAEREEALAAEDAEEPEETETPEAPAEAAPAETPEQTPAEPEAEGLQSEKIAKVFESLARKEKALRVREQEMRAKYAAVEAMEKARAAAAAGDPNEALRLIGLDYSQLTTAMLQRKPENAYEKRIAELETALQARTEQETRAAQEQAVARDIAILERQAKANQDRYAATLAEEGGIGLAYDVVREHYERTGQVMPVEEALDRVETYLIDRAQRIVSAKKQVPQGTQKPGIPAQPARPGQRSADGPRTLTTQLPTVSERGGGEVDDDLHPPEWYRRRAEKALRRQAT